jgi:hypothetical protein
MTEELYGLCTWFQSVCRVMDNDQPFHCRLLHFTSEYGYNKIMLGRRRNGHIRDKSGCSVSIKTYIFGKWSASIKATANGI